jgi:hypothetical protein
MRIFQKKLKFTGEWDLIYLEEYPGQILSKGLFDTLNK